MMAVLDDPVEMREIDDLGPNEATSGPSEIQFIDPLADRSWDTLVLSHPLANPFHSSAWARVLSKTYRHKPVYFRVHRDGFTEALVPLMEVSSPFTGRRGVCLPFSDLCGPLLFVDSESTAILRKLLTLAQERRWSYFELRDRFPAPPSLQYFGHVLDLTKGAEALFADCSSSVRRAVRKATASGLTATKSQTWEAVRDFYRLHVETRRRHGLPPQPIAFFRNIFREMIEPGHGFVVRAAHRSRCVAAAVFFQFGRTAVYKFGASALALQRLRGNNLVMWEAIRLLAQSGCEILHFGRTSSNNATLRRFKLGWGTREEMIRYHRWNTSAGDWTTGRDKASGTHTAIFSRLPLTVNRLAGTLLYPHLD